MQYGMWLVLCGIRKRKLGVHICPVSRFEARLWEGGSRKQKDLLWRRFWWVGNGIYWVISYT